MDDPGEVKGLDSGLLCSVPAAPQAPRSPLPSPPQVLETCVKNCGHRFHILVANRDFIDSVLVKIISPKNNPPTIVQDKVLALIQVGQGDGPLVSGSSCLPIR